THESARRWLVGAPRSRVARALVHPARRLSATSAGPDRHDHARSSGGFGAIRALGLVARARGTTTGRLQRLLAPRWNPWRRRRHVRGGAPPLPRARAPNSALGLRLPMANTANARHRGRVWPADSPHVRTFFRMERELPS